MRPMSGTPKYIPLEQATTPRSGECIADSWWAHVPGKGLIYYVTRDGYAAPQCNTIRAVAEGVIGELWPDAEIIHVPAVFSGRYSR